jgi:hypothetical protein
MNINDRELLARTLQAEAGNQGYDGMLAAGSVIMNRANATGYGDGMRGVILKPGQFSVWNSRKGPDGNPIYANGEQGRDMANMRASDGAYKAADALIAGTYEDATGGATHYYNPEYSQPKWGQKAGGDWKRIGDHVFGFADAGKKPNPSQAIASDTMRALGKQPNGLLGASQAPNNTESKMIPEEKPRGLLGSLGIQKMEEGAEGEAGQRFFERDTFKDTAANLAQGFAAMGSSPALQKMTADVASQRTESKAKNKTIEYLRANGRGDLADAVDSGSLGIRDAAGIMFAQPKTGKVATAIEEFEYAKTRGELPEGVDSLPKYKKYIARAGRNVPDVTMHPTLDRPLSPMEISIDNEMSKTFGDTVITGIGAANRNAATIKSVIDRLGNAEEGEALTGPLKGALGSFGRNVFAPTSQAILDDVGGVVQQSLREILGGQFAQKEGEQLIARAYNISSAPEVNAARLRALYMQLESISANKAALVDYVKANGTSAGFAGSSTNPSVDTFYNAMKQAESQMGVSDNQGPNTPEEQASIQQKRTVAMQRWLKSNNRGAD